MSWPHIPHSSRSRSATRRAAHGGGGMATAPGCRMSLKGLECQVSRLVSSDTIVPASHDSRGAESPGWPHCTRIHTALKRPHTAKYHPPPGVASLAPHPPHRRARSPPGPAPHPGRACRWPLKVTAAPLVQRTASNDIVVARFLCTALKMRPALRRGKRPRRL
jgi:hypothetical protein